jgi:hypothetical protein
VARNFNGSTDDLQRGSAVVTAYPMTMAGWARCTAATGVHAVLGVSRHNQAGRQRIACNMTAGVAVAESFSHPSTQGIAALGTPSQNVWHHFAGTFSGAASRFVFLDGVKSSESTTNVAFDTGMTRTSIGAVLVGGTETNNFAGDIGVCAIWNVVLADLEIAALAAGVHPWRIRPSNLLALWDPGLQSPEIDLTPNGNSLTVNGSTRAPTGPPVQPLSRLFVPVSFPSAVVVTATGAQTLPGLTQAGSGGQEYIGAGAQTLAAPTQAGSGVMQPEGTGAQTLAAFTQEGVGAEILVGTATQTFAALTQAAAGQSVELTSGAGAQSLVALVQAATGAKVFLAAGAQILEALTQAGVGVMQSSGTGVLILPSLTQAGVGSTIEGVSATGGQALAALAQSGAGVEHFIGTGAQALPALVQAGIGAEAFVGAAAQSLAALIQAGSAVEIFAGSAAQVLAALAQSGSGVEIIAATATQTLVAPAQAGAGVMHPTGVGVQVLAAVTQQGTGVLIVLGVTREIELVARKAADPTLTGVKAGDVDLEGKL